jgi:hypothetical protein
MNPGPPTKPRLCLALDEQGRTLFVPWYPLSRRAYVVPDAMRRSAIEQWMRLSVAWALGLLTALFVLGAIGRLPRWSASVLVVLIVLEWAWWTRRQTRDLERTRLERPSG